MVVKYITDEKINAEERKERFEVAWDIWEHFEEAQQQLKVKLFRDIEVKIYKEFGDEYFINNRIISCNKHNPMKIFKKKWADNENIGVFNYAIEADHNKIINTYHGIKRFRKKEKIRGEDEVLNALREINGGYKEDFQDWWVGWLYPPEPYKGMWQKEFFLEILDENTRNRVIDYFVNKLVEVKDRTEHLIDKVVDEFKNVSGV